MLKQDKWKCLIAGIINGYLESDGFLIVFSEIKKPEIWNSIFFHDTNDQAL